MCLAIPGKITGIYEVGGLQMGKVDFGGITKEACLAYLEDPQVGDYTMIHVGFAISKVDEEEAFRTLELLKELGELDELYVDNAQSVADTVKSADETSGS
ncbi:MAG: HypC/HybG/HupF family hydrogenase formation chaperone [Anaerolineaceae bacterium]|nr:HypC/HybG/HupF family hydrogenase formation chaperone [Anaerolineaceae bacterium]